MTSLVSPEQPVLCIPTRPSDTTGLTDAVWLIQGSSCREATSVTLRHHCQALQAFACVAVTHKVAMLGACLKDASATSGCGFCRLQNQCLE